MFKCSDRDKKRKLRDQNSSFASQVVAKHALRKRGKNTVQKEEP